MIDETAPQFFIPNATGESVSVYKTVIDNLEALQSSEIKARNRQPSVTTQTKTLILDGIPGIPFDGGAPNPDVFYQGEDVVYDLYLLQDGDPVSSDVFDITAIVKPSPRANTTLWEGVIDAGVYTVPDRPGFYELWIPATTTETFIAGTYYLQVQTKEKTGAGRFPRRTVLLTTYFNIDYSNFSANPESRNNADLRASVTAIWPNSPNTIGKPNFKTATAFFTTE
jgi:hypothetical protein